MFRKAAGLLIVLFFLSCSLQGQDTLGKKQTIYKADKLALGFGSGYEYSGLLGANLVWYPLPELGFTGSFGYSYIAMAGNAGIHFRLTDAENSSRTTVYITGLYGSTHTVEIKGRSNLNKIFYGGMAGGGIEIRSKKREGYFSIGVIYPFTWKKLEDYKDELIQYRGVTFDKDPLEGMPVRFSLGYKWILK